MTFPEEAKVAGVGKDARTDALVQGLAASPHVKEVIGISELSSPPGMLERCSRFLGDVSLTDIGKAVRFLEETHPDLVVNGPEEPLCVGLANEVEDRLDIRCFGPRQELAQIEGSKSWARLLVDEYGIEGNPEYHVLRSPERLEQIMRNLGEFVIKPDGLTGGKGVKVYGEHLTSFDDALSYAESLIADDGVVVVEERLEGEEFSLQSITDGDCVVHCPVVQDHKRAQVDDLGPNTGGMGSYSCADFSLPFLTSQDVLTAQTINERVIKALGEKTGRRYHGVLYGGFMATSNGIKLIEYNARFGDPEALNILPLVQRDIFEICWAAATETLGQCSVSFRPQATVCKYIVPELYPTGKGNGDPVDVPREAIPDANDPHARLYWAAVNKRGENLFLTGSRAIAVVGIADTVAEASAIAEGLTGKIRGPIRHRPDIGTTALINNRIDHMKQLRRQASE